MFNSFVIRLQSLENGILNDVSKEIYSYLYKLVNENEKNNYFTVSSFFKYKKYNLDIEEGKYYLFKVSTLNIDTFSIFTSHLFKSKILSEDISIGNYKFRVKEIICDENKSKYAKRFDNSRFRYINSDECDIREYRLRFITPVVFKIGSQIYSDITSDILFRNILTKFNRYSGYTIDKRELKEIHKINIITEYASKDKFKIGKSLYEGVRGDITISLDCLDDKIIKIARTLIEFSLYSGIGYKSEVGFGHVIML